VRPRGADPIRRKLTVEAGRASRVTLEVESPATD
jgi:hypothetical protein